MSRFLFGGCMVVIFGCGARTESFTDPDGSSGAFGVGGATASAGHHFGGAVNVGGFNNQIGGAVNVSGSPSIGGSFGAGGASSVAGAPSKGGASFGGAVGKGGASFGGAVGKGGDGGTSGVEEACRIIATDPCQACLCSTCSSQIVQCISNIGCALIFACAQQTGCQGASCYDASTCKPVIDQYGGLTGTAMRNVFSILTCATGSQNSCNCN